MTPFTSEKILNKVLFIFICVLILFGFIIFTDRILILRQKWQEETNKEKIEKLDVKVDNLSATTTSKNKEQTERLDVLEDCIVRHNCSVRTFNIAK